MRRLFSSILFLEIVGLIINSIAWSIIYFKIRPTAEVIPLHYNVFYGVDYAGPGYYAYVIPLVGLLILIINSIFFQFAKKSELFAARILVSVGSIVQIFILVAILFLKSKILV